MSPGAMQAAANFDAGAAANQQIAALKQENAALKARVDKLEAAVAKLDAGLGQMVTVNVNQGQQINSKANASDLADLDARFKAHKHTYAKARISFMNKNFVTSSHLNGDDKDLASYININTVDYVPTSAPVN